MWKLDQRDNAHKTLVLQRCFEKKSNCDMQRVLKRTDTGMSLHVKLNYKIMTHITHAAQIGIQNQVTDNWRV